MDGVKDLMSDAFTTLPLLLIGLVFFLGTLTSNTGLLFLFMGHLLIVPALGFLGNECGVPWKNGFDTFLFRSVVSYFIFFMIHSSTLTNLVGNNAYYLFLTVLFPVFCQIRYPSENPPFFYINPLAWIGKWREFEEIKPEDTKCGMIPYQEKVYTNPSDWINHISFFFGFIISNAAAIYNEPKPELGKGPEDTKKSREEQLQQRVNNRKMKSASIIGVSIIVFIFILVFRFKTGCENSFIYTAIPIFFACITGVSFFTLIYTKCGVRPTDVLGIVQGMIPTELIDNPIVCVG